jgi:ion channel-forming bestrophin family protein
MILRRNFRLWAVVPYVWRELLGGLAWAALLAWLASAHHLDVSLPFAPLGLLGTALAIFLGLRNNQAYARWWEARTLWSALANHSRIVARLVISAARLAPSPGKITAAQADGFARAVVYRQIAFAHALRLHLRRQDRWDEVRALLDDADWARVRAASNRPNLLLQLQGEHLKRGVADGVLSPFDPISLEPNLAACATAQGGCERLKTTPILRPYDFFTRAFLVTFYVLLGPACVGLFAAARAPWLAVPVSALFTVVFALVNRVGEVTEDPFENKTQDVPLLALCNAIERDLREQLGEPELPPPTEPVDQVLW